MNYKLTQIQDECFITKKGEIVVLVKKVAKNVLGRVYERVDTEIFPNRDYIDLFLKENCKIKVVSEEVFRTSNILKAKHLISALN